MPKLSPKDSTYDQYVSSFIKQKRWKYLREMYTESAPTRSSGCFRISSSKGNVKHIYNRRQEDDPYIMNAFELNRNRNNSYLTNCRLEYGNGVFYPETEYDTDFKMRIYNDIMSHAMRRNDYNSRTQVNTSNFNSIYGIIYFDLTYQSENNTRDPKELVFGCKINQNAAFNFSVNAIDLYEEEVVIDKIGNELVKV